MSSALIDSEVVGEWKQPVQMFICPPPRNVQSDLCDCGFEGEWEYRFVYIWHEQPGYVRTDRMNRWDLARGWPVRAHDPGRWVVGGRDERCPGCGDIERFDMECERVATRIEPGRVVTFLDAHRSR